MAKIFGVHEKAPNTNLISFAGVTYPVGLGAVTSAAVFGRRVGDFLELEGYGVAGTVTSSGSLSIILPGGYVIDSSKLPSGSGETLLNGAFIVSATGAATSIYSGVYLAQAFYDGSTTNTVFFGFRAGSSVITKDQPSNVAQSNQPFSWHVRIPIVGWSANDILRDSDDSKI